MIPASTAPGRRIVALAALLAVATAAAAQRTPGQPPYGRPPADAPLFAEQDPQPPADNPLFAEQDSQPPTDSLLFAEEAAEPAEKRIFPDLDPRLEAAWLALQELGLEYISAQPPAWKPLTPEELAARQEQEAKAAAEAEKHAKREARRARKEAERARREAERQARREAREAAKRKKREERERRRRAKAGLEEPPPEEEVVEEPPPEPPTTWGIWVSLIDAGMRLENTPEALRAWGELWQLYGNFTLGRSARLSSLNDWFHSWPGHPAQEVASALAWWLSDESSSRWPASLALALPLSGALRQAGEITLAGIQAAYYRASTLQGFAPRIVVLDSASLSAQELANRAAAERVDFLIGPLEAGKVREMMEEVRKTAAVPRVLALNYVPDEPGAEAWEGEDGRPEGQGGEGRQPLENFWQLGLPVEQEIPILIEHARRKGYKRGGGLLIESSWGLRAGDHFETAWQEAGGEWAGSESISVRGDFTTFGRHLLLLDESERRIRTLRRSLGVAFEAVPRTRDDLDFIFMAAPAREGRRLRAALNFNQGRSVPLLTTSSIFSYEDGDDIYDLLGVFFADIPWMAKDTASYGMRQVSLYPGYRHRLFSLGIDAFTLAQRFTSLLPLQQLPMMGTTGLLWLGENGRLERRPSGLSILDPRRGPEILIP